MCTPPNTCFLGPIRVFNEFNPNGVSIGSAVFAGLRLTNCDRQTGNLSTWAIVEGGGSLRSPILGGRGRRPPATVGWKLEGVPFRAV